MNRYSTALSVIALAAVSAPYVCQAQDPAGKFKRITELQQNGKIEDALKMCDEMLKYFQGKSRTVQQYSFYEPFFVWKKGELLMAAKRYDEAYEAFKTLNTSEKFKAKAMREKAKRKKLLNGEGYDPYLTASGYYMGLCLYQKGVGDAKKKIAPDPTAFDKAIPALEEYLKLYQSGGVSKMEKSLKLDGQICFMLMQAYILQPTPDFKKAEYYLVEGRKSKSAIPDEMAMAGLSTVINVAMKNPEAISWVRDIIVSNPQSYSLGPVRMARHGSSFFGPAQNCEKMFKAALQEGNMKKANDSARSAIALMGMVPNMEESVDALDRMVGQVGTAKMNITDLDGARYNGADCVVVKGNYEKQITQNMPLDAFAVQLNASIALDYGCHRMAKAGYKILVDRFPDLSTKGKDGKPQPLGDKLKQGYAQLSRTTGDEATALAVEASLNPENLGDEGALTLEINRMVQAQKDKRWDDVLTAADKIISSSVIKKTSPNYLQAHLSKVAALKELKREEEAIAAIDAIFKENVIENATDATPEARTSADRMLRFHQCIGYYTLMRKGGGIDSAHLASVLKTVEDYEKKYPNADKSDEYLPSMYFYALQALMLRSDKEDFEPALVLCGKFKDTFSSHDYYASVLVVEANINIHLANTKKDKSKMIPAIKSLEKAYKVALERNNKPVAGEALNKLAVNGRTVLMPKEGGDGKQVETVEEQSARVLGYFKVFWEQVDAGSETNRFALQMCRLELSAVKGDKPAFDAAVARTKTIIAREADYALAQKKINPEVAKTITSFITIQTEVNGWKLPEIETCIADLKAVISDKDKTTSASLVMAQLAAINEAIAESGETPELVNKQKSALADLSNNYKPEELTNDVCLTIGEYFLSQANVKGGKADQINATVKQAEPYFKAAIQRGGEYVIDCKCGLADVASIATVAAAEKTWRDNTEKGEPKTKITVSGDESTKLNDAIKLYDEVIAADVEFALTNRARLGKARAMLVLGGNAEAVLALTKQYLEMDSESEDAIRMLQIQASAYEQLGKVDEAIKIHYAMMQDYMGSIGISAPACAEMMRLMWNNPNQGQYSEVNGKVTHTAKWNAWNRGNNYVAMINKDIMGNAEVRKQVTQEEVDAFTVVRQLVDKYGASAEVQEETRREQNDMRKYQ